jgi:hypothetical protein
MLIAIGVLLFLITTAASLALLAHNEGIATLLVRLDEGVNRRDKKRYSYEHYYPDFEDRLVNEELRSADYSRGGVYLIGTSNLKWATRFWELPTNERALVHNYGVGSTDLRDQFQFVRYLVEHEGLLAAGGDRSMVILGTSYHAAAYDPDGWFAKLWQRHGLYRYTYEEGISPIQVSGVWRSIHFERVRIRGFAVAVVYTTARQLGYHARVRVHNAEEYKKQRTEFMGPDWRDNIRRGMSEFEAMADYLRKRGVKLVVVFLPMGSWDRELPFGRVYMAEMNKACREKAVPVMDWSTVFDDDDFADSNHPNVYGVDKLQPLFLELAIPFLRSSGALAKN